MHTFDGNEVWFEKAKTLATESEEDNIVRCRSIPKARTPDGKLNNGPQALTQKQSMREHMHNPCNNMLYIEQGLLSKTK